MFSSEYVAFKHIVETEDKKPASPRGSLVGERPELPKYLLPAKSKEMYAKALELNQSGYLDDFILISEFSEIEGPKPLFTMPTDGGIDFNKNDYSLHVMCVDFHVQKSTTRLEDQPKFGLISDTSVIDFHDLDFGAVTSCIHHFTLYDIEARGFVRPFCVSYLTYDRLKLVTYFESITEELRKITGLLKQNNYFLFKLDLEERLRNLRHTHETLTTWLNNTDKHGDEKFLKSIGINKFVEKKFAKFSLNSLDNMIKEISAIAGIVDEELERNQWLKSRPDEEMLMSEIREFYSDFARNFELERFARVDRSKSVGGELELNFDRLRPKIVYDLSSGATFDAANGGHIRVNFGSAKVMKSIHQLAHDNARQAFTRLRQLHKAYSAPLYVLRYRDMEKRTHTQMKPAESHSEKSESVNHLSLWSVTLGDVVLADFSYKIDLLEYNRNLLRNYFNYFASNGAMASSQAQIDSARFINSSCPAILIDDNNTGIENFLENLETENSVKIVASASVMPREFDEDYDFADSLYFKYKTSEEQVYRLDKHVADKYLHFYEFNFEAIFRCVLLKNYKNFLAHVFYTLLKGRPLIVISRFACDIDKLQSIVSILANFLPNSFPTVLCNKALSTTYKAKPVKLVDLKYFKLIGLSFDLNKMDFLNKKTQTQVNKDDTELLLKYVPITIRNYVSILDVDKNLFIGPKYTGTYLTGAVVKLKHLHEDSTAYLSMLSHVNYYVRLAFLLAYSPLFKFNSNMSEVPTLTNNSNVNSKKGSDASLVSKEGTSSIFSKIQENVNKVNMRQKN